MTTNAQHTPGPWEAGQHPAIANGWIVRPVLFGSRVRVLPECEGGAVLIKSKADAHLIAAATELLEGAQDAVEAFALLRLAMRGDAKAIEMIDAHISELNFAIRKATGEPK